jgi:hypothetical protein
MPRVVYTPLSPGRTRASMAWYFVEPAARSPDFAAAREQILDRWLGPSRQMRDRAGLRSQDFHCLELQQAARGSPVADIVRFSPTWERRFEPPNRRFDACLSIAPCCLHPRAAVALAQRFRARCRVLVREDADARDHHAHSLSSAEWRGLSNPGPSAPRRPGRCGCSRLRASSQQHRRQQLRYRGESLMG